MSNAVNPNTPALTNETMVTREGARWHPTRNEDGRWVILNAELGTVLLDHDAKFSALALVFAGYQVG